MSIVNETRALELIRQGEVVALPTETVYGLAGRIDSNDTLKKIFAVKQRPFFDPLIVHVHAVEQARALCREWPALWDVLARRFWPGPLTLISPKADSISSIITSGLETVAIRCPNHPVALKILREFGTPLAAPSANRFGRVSPTSAQHVEAEFNGEVAVVDGGPCLVGVESTVLATEYTDGVWRVKILRPGGVSRVHLRKALEEEGLKFQLLREESVASPGHLKAHYQPTSPVVLLNGLSWNDTLQKQTESRLGRKLNGAVELHLPATAQEAARVLYEEFRRLSTDPNRIIYIVRKPAHSGEDWEAVWDRVERASTTTF